ncbi:hypothetical protein N0B44_15670 [Roseibacterium beibuensis]|uniref:Uncharacterized protein n=1 Tax=[Roseibacterium] beibuensis TaxID=1193142 RepID=A0ABP9LBY6_9RHOB|nr:hypothetical protein [Roseibacterium beibuensis]MCS6624357.1 hypothetical protein [Roseibacterium beibuensis]
MSDFEFRTCPRCNGYGVLDSGRNCPECGGVGRGGLHGSGQIGSGEIIIETGTGRRVSLSEFLESVGGNA